MKSRTTFLLGVFFLAWGALAVFASAANSAGLPEEILELVERRYSGPGFSARFDQESTLKAMDITDTASGRLIVKRPGMMRWEYEVPDPQLIVSNGKTLWIYRPEDNQVMVGAAPKILGGGKGVSFLSDIRLVRENFDVALESDGPADIYMLKLVPKEAVYDIRNIQLAVSRQTHDVVEVATVSAYGDVTRIRFHDFRYQLNPEDALFSFPIPEGTDVLQLEQ